MNESIERNENPEASLRTPLHQTHRRFGAKMVAFAGWEMPLLYRGIIPEHRHTRRASSIFDVSHMGRIEIGGPDAEALLEHLCTRRLGDMPAGRLRYSHMCNEAGWILDDLVVARREDRWLVVCNASNRKKILDWIAAAGKDKKVTIEDITLRTAMFALQGPATLAIVSRLLPLPMDPPKRWSFVAGTYMGMDYFISRSGYTGEDGLEVIVPAMIAELVWQRLCPPGASAGDETMLPAGLGARDTLRIEAGLPLYGHELTEQIDPISAGFAWAVDLEKDFVGAETLRRIAREGPAYKLAGLELPGRRIARPPCDVHDESGNKIGWVTSGTLGPTLNKSIAMAYLSAEYAEPGAEVCVPLRNQQVPATVVPLPFYRAQKKQPS